MTSCVYHLPNGIDINNNTADSSGTFWFAEDLLGWDAPDVRASILNKVSDEGQIPADLHYNGRTLTFQVGWAECPADSAGGDSIRDVARDRLASAVNLVQQSNSVIVDESAGRSFADGVISTSTALTSATAAFVSTDVGSLVSGTGIFPGTTIATVTNGTTVVLSHATTATASSVRITLSYTQSKQMTIFRNPSASLRMTSKGKMVSTSRGPCFPFQWQAVLFAPDPRKYATVPTTVNFGGGSATFNNRGDFPALPVISLTTSSDPITLTNTTTGLALVLSVKPGQPALPATVVLDFLGRTITDGSGGNRYDLRLLSTPWWTLPPGENVVTVTGASAGSVTAFSTWI